MAEYTANALQTVLQNQNILFTDTAICSNNPSIVHRSGSGLVTLRGLTSCQCRSRFKVYFNGNVAGIAGPITLAISINGEALQSSTMIVTPTVTDAFFNASAVATIDVPAGCCSQVSVKNLSNGAINVQNANLVVERVA